MSADNPRNTEWRWHSDSGNAASNPSLSRVLPGDAAPTPAFSDSPEKFGVTRREHDGVRNIYLLYESYQAGGMRVDSLAEAQSSSLEPHSASARDDASSRPSGRLWIRAACLLGVAAAALAGWVWLVRLLLAA